MVETTQGKATARSRPNDPLDEVRAAVREDRLKLERRPIANIELKPGAARKR